jgi:hypothetical protein
VTEQEDDQFEDDAPVEFASLAQRVNQRRAELQSQRTVTLDVPGYVGILAAEYRLLTWPTIRKIAHRHRKVRDEGVRELYVASDTLLLACEQVFEVKENGLSRPLGLKWGPELAVKLGVDNLPEASTNRQALIAIFDVDSRIVGHYSEYVEWQQGEGVEVDQEVVADFVPTG